MRHAHISGHVSFCVICMITNFGIHFLKNCKLGPSPLGFPLSGILIKGVGKVQLHDLLEKRANVAHPGYGEGNLVSIAFYV